jgi:E1A-binding protein p400
MRSKIQYLSKTNRQRCSFTKPMYGRDLHECVRIRRKEAEAASCDTLQQLLSLLNTVEYETQLFDILSRFVLYIPSVIYSSKRVNDFYENNLIKLQVKHPDTSFYGRQRVLIEDITGQARRDYTAESRLVNAVELHQSTQFPEKRLIEYDCGKLQTLSRLLRRLFNETHRALIFTQMTRMLDILENFLNYHGYKYLRLDGSTSIERRQALMERFNNDKRIFCMILSTRSGGIGVNLTGADTVIFYDSDWNPTMDAQAQDRCHRIGQTRDVNIYRLISEKSIEENILKKANQKRLLNEMTIEGGCFTTALLKPTLITELFEDLNESAAVPSPQSVSAPLAIASSSTATATAGVASPPPPPIPTETLTKENESEFEKVAVVFNYFSLYLLDLLNFYYKKTITKGLGFGRRRE